MRLPLYRAKDVAMTTLPISEIRRDEKRAIDAFAATALEEALERRGRQRR
jgi:hypothetical protein